MRNLNLRWRFLLAAFLIVISTFGMISFFLNYNSRYFMLRVTIDNLLAQSRLAAREIASAWRENTDPDPLADNLSSVIDRRVTIISPKGRVLGDSEVNHPALDSLDNHLGRPEIRQAMSRGWGYSVRYSHTIGRDLIYLAVPLEGPNGLIGYCRLAWPLSDFLTHQRRLFLIMAIGLLVFAFLLLVALDLAWKKLLWGIAKIEQTGRRLLQGDLMARAPTNLGIPEMDRISHTLNQLAENWGQASSDFKDRNLKLSGILDGMSEGVIVVNNRQQVTLINHAARQILDIPQRDEIRTIMEMVRHPEMEKLARGEIGELSFPYRQRHLLARSRTLEEEQGVVVVLSDITRLMKLEALRREFVANVSHELKTPVAAIVGLAEAMIDGTVEGRREQKDYLVRIKSQAERMARLVSDLLDLSALEAEEVVLHRNRVSARRLVDRVMESLAPNIEKSGHKVTLVESHIWLLEVMVDEGRIVQALSNLLDNAIKYSLPNSTIELEASKENGYLRISVIDHGPGIASEHLPRLFERFYRVDKSRSREMGGTGLGLAIVKHIMELHSGMAGVESELGQGSRFWISLPLMDKTGEISEKP